MLQLKTSVIRGTGEGPHLLITAGVHGDEFEGVVAVGRLLRKLTAAQLRGSVTLVPVVNESAFQEHGRCGSDGLDLARSCPGDSSGSVTQQVAAALVALIESADLYVDLHSGGVVMEVYPLAGYMLVDQPAVIDAQRRMARVFGLPLVWGTSSALDGRSLSVARDAQVPAIYVEYLGGGQCSQPGVDALLEGCLNVLAEFGMIEGSPSVRAEPAVYENESPGSGHMQACYPSPATGVFEPSVRLGQRVEVGQPLGLLSDPATGDSSVIPASESGAVVVLRTYPRVAQGESLGVVLEDAAELPRCGSGAPS